MLLKYLVMIRTLIPVLACAALLGGTITGILTSVFLSTAKSTNGTILSSDELTSDNGEVLYQPSFVFTVDGRDYTVTPVFYIAPSPGVVGEPVPILYDPRDPRRASIDSFVYTWMMPVIMVGLGVAFGVIHFTLNFISRFIGSATMDGGSQ